MLQKSSLSTRMWSKPCQRRGFSWWRFVWLQDYRDGNTVCIYIYIYYYIILYCIILYYILYIIYMMSKNVQDIQTWQCNAVPNFWHSLEMLLAPSTVLSCPLPLDHPTIRFHTACQGGDLIVVVVLLVSFPWIEIWLISYIIEICRNM